MEKYAATRRTHRAADSTYLVEHRQEAASLGIRVGVVQQRIIRSATEWILEPPCIERNSLQSGTTVRTFIGIHGLGHSWFEPLKRSRRRYSGSREPSNGPAIIPELSRFSHLVSTKA